MRVILASCFIGVCAATAHAQSGPCTEAVINQGKLSAADDAFSYMPPYGRPVVGKSEIKSANTRSFSERTNITRSWVGEHRIVTTPSGDMAYEYGTMRMGYDEKGAHTEFEAVMLTVYKVKGNACQVAALTMQPIDEEAKR
jgi:hypothetical protein